jgi:hypothetical protein
VRALRSFALLVAVSLAGGCALVAGLHDYSLVGHGGGGDGGAGGGEPDTGQGGGS